MTLFTEYLLVFAALIWTVPPPPEGEIIVTLVKLSFAAAMITMAINRNKAE